MKRRLTGYTLIELLAVIAIIGILASLAAISISNATKRARDAQRQRDLSNLKTALELYAQDEGKYPSLTDGLDVLKPDYIKVKPKDPQLDKGWLDYAYTVDGDGENYLLVAVLETKNARKTLPDASACDDPIDVKGNGVTDQKDSIKSTPCFRLTND